MNEAETLIVVMTMFILAGVGLMWMAMSNRRHIRELEHRERLAMIQRGLMPAPEVDPQGFEAAVDSFEQPRRRASERWRSAGITLVGLGLALMVMLSATAGSPDIGIGIGGAFAILGGTLLFNSAQLRRNEARNRMPPYPPQYPPRHQPPHGHGAQGPTSNGAV